jgi:acetylornithine deacetylase/succinyl-diaminopimelate desuccinylase-like protein
LEDIKNYVKDNYQNFIEELKEFLRIPSISTLASHKKDIAECAAFTAEKLKHAGLSRVEIFGTEGHPIVYGEWLGAPGKPTILIYGHYDVQPVDPLELWDSPPFEPVVKDGKIYARGANDNKGQLFVHIKSLESYFNTAGSPPLNVKFIVEGEEEIGSEHLEKFIKNNADLLKCDAILISDTDLYAEGTPTLTYGLRGIVYFDIEVLGSDRDLHSGTFGGAVPNPINILTDIISSLHNKEGKITIPGFYDDVVKVSRLEREKIKSLKFSEKKFAKSLKLKELTGEKGYSALERTWVRPSLDCNGIYGGFTGEGAKTIIPSKASAKVSIRLVPGQNPNKVFRQCTRYINKIAPKSIKLNISYIHGGPPSLTPLSSNAVKAASSAMEKAFGRKTLFVRDGGSIPVVNIFDKRLKTPIVLMGLGLSSENLHSPNEHFNLNHFRLGILSSAFFMNEFAITAGKQ